MAGDWIKVRTRLLEDPAVFRMADLLGISVEAVGGHLIRVWSWATDQVIDGNAPGVTEKHIDRIACVTGMGAALACVGWITFADSGAHFPNWERHLAQGAKARALTAMRVAKSRNGASVTESLPEKRREDQRTGKPAPESPHDKNNHPAPSGAVEDFETPNAPTMADRAQIRQGLIRIGVESGAAQQVSLHPLITLAMVRSTYAAVKKAKGIKSQAAVVLTRLRHELGMIEEQP